MEKETNNSEVIKKYSRELRDLIENDGLLILKEQKALQEKYLLTRDDIDKIEEMSLKLYEKAKSDFDFGNWDQALSNIEAAFNKSPFNVEVISLYCNILIEYSKVNEDSKKQQVSIEPFLNRLQQVDKKEYFKIKKTMKIVKKSNFNKLWLLLLLAFIPLFFLIKKDKPKTPSILIPEYPTNRELLNGEVPVTIKNKVFPSNPIINVIKSKIESSTRSFVYSLQFTVSSEKENLLQIKGQIIWLDRNGNEIFTDSFIAGENKEYFLNELIPFSYNKSSLRSDPDLYNVVIRINEIMSLPGRERGQLEEIPFTLPDGLYRKLQFSEASYSITEGVVSDYLSLVIIVKNNDSREIQLLNGNIIWVDEYNIKKTGNAINLISKDSIPLQAGEKRTIHKTIELKGEITPEYQIEVMEIK